VNKACREYRDDLLALLHSDSSVDELHQMSSHPETCPVCARYLREITELVEYANAAGDASLQDPKYGRMRARVWEAVDRKAHRPGIIASLTSLPGIAGVVVGAAVAILVTVFWLGDGQQPPTGMTGNYPLTEISDYDVAYTITESEVDSLLQRELTGPVSEYLLSKEDYSTLEAIYRSDNRWEEVLDELIAGNM